MSSREEKHTKNLDEMRSVAARLAGNAEMLDVRMVQSNFEHLDFPQPGGPIQYELEVNPGAQLNDESDRMVTSVEFDLKMSQEIEENVTDIASINFRLVGLYELSGDAEFSEEEISCFAETTGVFALYPYAREYVQDVTGRLGLPPLTLGLYKIPTNGE